MPGDLSNGLVRLSVAGTKIVSGAASQAIRLRGVNRSGLEYAEPGSQGFLESAGISEPEISHMVREWGANVIRVPFTQDWVLHGRGAYPASTYLDALDQVIYYAARAGAYTILDLQWIDADVPRGRNADGSFNRVPSLPNSDSIAVWSILAERYREEPAVLFDLFNEPHDPLSDDLAALEGIDEDGRALSAALAPRVDGRMAAVGQAPRSRDPSGACRVVALRFGGEVGVRPQGHAADARRGFDRGLVERRLQHARVSVVRKFQPAWRPSVSVRTLPSWREAFGHLSRTVPVFVAEWGGGPEHVRWGETLIRYLEEAGYRMGGVELVGLPAARRQRAGADVGSDRLRARRAAGVDGV